MPLSVASVIFCTSSAWIVALSAWAFWSSQNCTALSSAMRFSNSSTLSVGATQLVNCGKAARPGIWLVAPFTAEPARFCRKSNPGTKRAKPKPLWSSLICRLLLIVVVVARSFQNISSWAGAFRAGF